MCNRSRKLNVLKYTNALGFVTNLRRQSDSALYSMDWHWIPSTEEK